MGRRPSSKAIEKLTSRSFEAALKQAEEAKVVSADLVQVAVNGDYQSSFPTAPTKGPSKGVSDGDLMKAVEPFGSDLDYTLVKAAKQLDIPLVTLMFRLKSTAPLRQFYEVVRAARAQMLQEARDELLDKMCALADSEVLTAIQFKAYERKLRTIEKDMSVFDREVYGPSNNSTRLVADINAAAGQLVEITTSIDGE